MQYFYVSTGMAAHKLPVQMIKKMNNPNESVEISSDHYFNIHPQIRPCRLIDKFLVNAWWVMYW